MSKIKKTSWTHTCTAFAQTDTQVAEHLRSLERLAIVGLDFFASPFRADEVGKANDELYAARIETDLKAWKERLIEVLKDSPSKERKLLRWEVCEKRRSYSFGYLDVVLEEGELEVLPETFL